MRDLRAERPRACTPIRGLPAEFYDVPGRLAQFHLSIRSKGRPMKTSFLLLQTIGALSLAAAMPAAAQDVPAPQPSAAAACGCPERRRARSSSAQGVAAQHPIAIPAYADAAGRGHGRRQHRARSATRSPTSSPPISATRNCSRRSARAACRAVSFPQVTAPDYPLFLARPAPRIWSRASSRPMATARSPSAATSTTSPPITSSTRQGYVVQPRDWRRAAHRCADAIFSRLTGEGGYFDTRVVYVSETGPGAASDQAARDHGL